MRCRSRRASLSRRAFVGGAASLALSSSCQRRSAPAGRRTASLWFTYGGRNRRVLEELVQRFNASQSRHFIVAVYQGDYFEGLAKLRTAVAAKAGPALSHVVGEVVPYLAEAGVLEPLSDYEGAKSLRVLPALGQSGSWVGGAERPLVALPFNRSTPIAYINGPLFQKHSFSPPKTWEELRQVAAALAQHEGATATRHGFGCPIDWWFWTALVGQAGGRVIEADGRVSLGDAAGVEAIELWKAMVTVDRSMKPPPGRDYKRLGANQPGFLGRAHRHDLDLNRLLEIPRRKRSLRSRCSAVART